MNIRKSIFMLRSNPVAPDPRVEKISLALFQEGYKVSVICWDRDGIYKKKDHFNGITIERIKILANYGSGLQNLPALIRWQLSLLCVLVKRHQEFQVLHACDFDTIVPAFICKILFKKIIVYDIFDFYSDHLRKTPHFLKNIIRRLDLFLINHVDGVILVDENRVEQIHGSTPRCLEFIYNSPKDIYDPNRIRDLNKEASFSIVYVGLLQWERGLYNLLEVFKNRPDWRLDIAGFGGDSEEVISSLNRSGNIQFHGRISYKEALALSVKADIVWALYDPAIPNHRYASPNKLFEAMMLGKPVIVAKNTNIDQIVKKLNCGYIVEYGNYEAIQETLDSCSIQSEIRKRKGENSRRAYEEKFSWKIMRKRLLALYKNILKDTIK